MTRNPEEKRTSNGVAVTTFNIACDRGFKKDDGTTETDFIPVVTWRGLAENCGRFLSKGKMVGVSGRLQIRTYEANDGGKRTIAEIVADDVQFLTPKGQSETSAAPAAYRSESLEETVPLDDIPF